MRQVSTLLIAAMSAITSSSALAQAPPILWQNTIGGNKADICYAIQQTNNGGYILGGSSNSGPTGDKSEQVVGNFDYWICRLDQNGNVMWNNTIGGNKIDYLSCIRQTADGGFILGGESQSKISGDKTANCRGDYDYWVVKVDQDGIVQWDKTIGGNKKDYLYSIQQTSDGGYIVGGYSQSGISGDKTQASRGDYDYWVVKLNSTGSIVWDKTIGGNNGDFLYSIVPTSDGGYLLGGTSGSKISGEKTQDQYGYTDYWIVKIDQYGNVLWDKTIGGSDEDYLYCVKKVSTGGFILGGYSESNISGTKTENCKGDYDYWIVKVDNNGNVVWDKTIGGSGSDELLSLQPTTDGGYILGGSSESNISGDKTENSFGLSDYWVVKLDQNANVVWDKTIGGDDEDDLFAIQQTTDGGYIAGGYSESNISGNKTENGQGLYDYWIVKLGAGSPRESAAGIVGCDFTLGADIFPNPSTGTFTIKLSGPVQDDVVITVLSSTGQTIFSQPFSADALDPKLIVSIDRKFTAGAYFVKISSGNQNLIKPILIQE